MTIPPDPTADQLRDRSRELLLQGLSRVEVLLDEGRRDLARSALRLLLDRADPEVARTITERAAVAELAREAGWIPPLRPDVRYVPAGRVTIRHGETRTPDPRQRAADAAAAAYLADQPPA